MNAKIDTSVATTWSVRAHLPITINGESVTKEGIVSDVLRQPDILPSPKAVAVDIPSTTFDTISLTITESDEDNGAITKYKVERKLQDE